jgi:hypothetical protein
MLAMRSALGALAMFLVCGSVVVLAVNPYLITPTSDHCFPLGTPSADICFPTRCSHLFVNGTRGRLLPTPQKFPQSYKAFRCNVTVWYEYGKSVPQRQCLRPMCTCRSDYRGGSCYPTQFNSCDSHQCFRRGKYNELT